MTTRKYLRIAAAFPAAVLFAVAMSVGASSASAESGDRKDTGSAAAIAPVLTDDQRSSRTYTQREMEQFDAQGGDPAVLEYWTEERMASAKPLDQPGDEQLVSSLVEDVTAALPGAVASEPVAAVDDTTDGKDINNTIDDLNTAAVTPITNFSVTAGKLFIGGYGGTSWCSASAINSSSKRLVITAGHCVHDGAGGTWKSNLVFVPEYNANASNPTPYGTFQAATLRTFNAWIDYGASTLNSVSEPGFARDVAFITTYTNSSSQKVVNAVGGNGLYYNGSYSFDVSIFGYPGNKSSGKVMWGCWGSVSQDGSWDYRSVITGCEFGGGSSGGPWLYDYNNSTGLGYTRGVMSTYNSTTKVNGSAHFDTAVYDMFVAANADW